MLVATAIITILFNLFLQFSIIKALVKIIGDAPDIRGGRKLHITRTCAVRTTILLLLLLLATIDTIMIVNRY